MIGAGVHLYSPVRLAESAQIGADGFGYEWNGQAWVDRPHEYGVFIGDHVDIGANSVIHRGRWRHTVIGGGTKIDAQVFVAHNVEIGRCCLIVAGAHIAGSVTIGDEVIVGLGANICPHITIGDRAIIGAGAVVTKDVPANAVVAGNPARYLRERREGETL